MYKILKDGAIINSKIAGKYAGYKKDKIFGRLDCKSGMRMKKENRVFFHTLEDAVKQGYRPCKNCKPITEEEFNKIKHLVPEKNLEDFYNRDVKNNEGMRYIKLFEELEYEEEPDWDDWDDEDELFYANQNPYRYLHVEFDTLAGKTLVDIQVNRNAQGDEIRFITDDNKEYLMYHEQDCCEHVTIEDINGDLEDIKNSRILRASEDSNEDVEDYNHVTYTFYNISTIKGNVTIRWYGSSNGYYSERVSFYRVR